MTRIFLFFIFTVFPAFQLFSQTTRGYWVHLDRQLNRDSLQALFKEVRMPASQRASVVLNSLYTLSGQTGKSVEDWIEQIRISRSGKIESVRRHRIVNGFFIQMEPSLITSLQQLEEVNFVEDVTDLHFYLIEPVRMEEEPAQVRAIGAAEPGLVAVGARFLWSLGYTGKGVKILSFDTGIWPEHPSFGGRFYGEYVPLRYAWNGIWSQFPVDKSSSHGTHTVGTMAGLDTATADTIGLAFRAYFMATDPIVSNLADTIGVSNLMACYEWAIDPDGNPNTTDDMPSVICNSWGTSGNAGFCGSFVADMLELIDIVGIANEYSAGNNGPGMGTVGIPALMNPGILNAFAVGAVNGNIPSFPIANFSGRGPTPCLGGGSVEIKPEVVAPGVNVRSAVRKDGYAFYDGTSMAGPHVAGVMALLKEAFPDLPGEELKAALYFSATDLGDPGEDNTFGRGMIHAEAAFQWLLDEGHVPVSPVSPFPELAIEKPPVGMLDLKCSPNWIPSFSLFNEGNIPIQDTILFSVELNGVPAPGWSQFVSLLPGQRIQIQSPDILTLQEGRNEIWISAKQRQVAQEKDMVNNNRTFRFTYIPEQTAPYSYRFEADSLNAEDWNLLNPDMGRTFELYNTAGQDSGAKSAAIRWVLYSPADGQADYLIAPVVRLEGGTHVIGFDVAHQLRAANAKDSLFVFASSDCGFSFPHRLFSAGATQLATASGTSPTNFIPSQPEHWKRFNLEVPESLSNQTVIFALVAQNRRGGNLFIDDFSIFPQFDPLGYETLSQPEPAVFPNPFSNSIQLRIPTGQTAYEVNLFDVSGRNIPISLSSAAEQTIMIETENIPTGLYFLRVKTSSGAYTFRLICQN